MITERDVQPHFGRVLHVYDTSATDTGAARGPTVFWCHGTPNIGRPPEPLSAVGAELGVRWVGVDRPGYGGSTARPDRTVADDGADLVAVADALGIGRFAVLTHSGGGPSGIAAAALAPDRVTAVAAIAPLAPPDADGLDWFAGLSTGGRRELTAAREGRSALLRLLEAGGEDDDEPFTDRDHAALAGEWSWFGGIVEAALVRGFGPMADDDVTAMRPWGVDPAAVRVPALVVAGDADRMVPASHSAWLAARIPHAELWLRPGDGHISVLAAAPDALRWLAASAPQTAV